MRLRRLDSSFLEDKCYQGQPVLVDVFVYVPLHVNVCLHKLQALWLAPCFEIVKRFLGLLLNKSVVKILVCESLKFLHDFPAKRAFG